MTKNCFGIPNGCIASGNCKAVVAVDVKAERYIFEMLGQGGKYVAVGISEDEKMASNIIINNYIVIDYLFIH